MSIVPQSSDAARSKARSARTRAQKSRDALSKLRAATAWVLADSRVPAVTAAGWGIVLEDQISKLEEEVARHERDERRFLRKVEEIEAREARTCDAPES